jgi:hypothetical protein
MISLILNLENLLSKLNPLNISHIEAINIPLSRLSVAKIIVIKNKSLCFIIDKYNDAEIKNISKNEYLNSETVLYE